MHKNQPAFTDYKGGDIALHLGIFHDGDDSAQVRTVLCRNRENHFWVKEVVYSNRSHASVGLTKEQKSLLEKLSIELH